MADDVSVDTMLSDNSLDLLALTTDIVAAHVGNNAVNATDLPEFIRGIHEALAELGKADVAPEQPKPTPAVGARKSTADPNHILSMIDGKPYASLKRHIGRHGYTPESYRETFGLPASYPMVAPAHSERRREVARQIGLGRKPKAAAQQATAGKTKPGGLKRALAAAKNHLTSDAPAKRGRGRPKKDAADKPG